MKTLKLFSMCVIALSMAFTSCKTADPIDVNAIVEDGFYIKGDASGAATLIKAGKMQNGYNENASNVQTAGLYEKYVALETGKTFTIVKKTGTVETTYGIDVVKDSTTTGADNNISGAKVKFGTYKENGTAFSVTKSQLYQVVVYEANKTVAIIPVKWQTNNLGTPDTLSLVGAYNNTTMTYRLTNVTVDLGNFKIKSYNGWKFDMTPKETVAANKVKVNCNFGATKTGTVTDPFKYDGTANNVMQGGPDIDITFANRGKYTIDVIWTLGDGNSHIIKFTKTAELPILDPKTFVVGLSGDAFATNTTPPGVWGDPAGATLAAYTASESTVSDQTTKAGTYTYTITNLKVDAGKDFKVRVNGGWVGYSADIIKGDAANFVDDGGNIKVVAATTYATVKFKVIWPANTVQVTFTK